MQTRPNISKITNNILQYNRKCSKGHIAALKYVIKYLLGTSTKGILFSSQQPQSLESFVQFPLSKSTLTNLNNTNWGH